MPRFPEQLRGWPNPVGSINTADWTCMGFGSRPANYEGGFLNFAPGANKRYYVPFTINDIVTVYGLGWYLGGTLDASGHIDVSIYDVVGNLLLDTGSTAWGGTVNTLQTVNTSDLLLLPGNYFLSIASDSATGTLKANNPAAISLEALGCKEDASAFAAPNPATLGAPATAWIGWYCAFIQPVF